MRRLCVALALLVGAGSFAGSLHAQDDWEVHRDPFDRRVIARYKAILARDPWDRGALGKLVALYRRYRTLDLLVKEYEAGGADDFANTVVLGSLERERGDERAALARYQHAATLRPDDLHVHLARGELLRRANDAAGARAAYEQALPLARAGKDKRVVLRELADLALDGGDVAAARGYYKQYIALEPRDLQVRLELADVLTHHGLHADALAELTETEGLARVDPALRIDVVARMGAAQEALGAQDAALREYRRCLALMPRGYHLRREITERIIEIHRQRQDLHTLLAAYEKEWPASSREHFEWDILARLYEETGAQEKAIDAYRNAVRKAPYELDTQRRLLALLENTGREAEAVRQYEELIRVAPGEPRFQLDLAERYWRRGEPKKALALLAAIERRFPDDAGVFASLADLYSRWGQEDRALAIYERLSRIEPDDPVHLVNLGEQYYQRNQKDKALAVWKRIAVRKDADGYARLGDVYAEHDLLPEALSAYGKAIRLDAKNPERLRGRAQVYERLKRWPEAVADWEAALALTGVTPADRPARREARRRIVQLLRLSGGLQERITAWRSAFYAAPPDVEGGYFLVEAYLKLGRTRNARDVLERLLELAPEDDEAMNQLVKVYKADRDYDKAIAVLDTLAQRSPGREREYYSEIAALETLRYRDDQALLYAQKALAKSPADPLAHQQLAETYERMQQYDKAVASYRKTLELDPRNFEVCFALARLYVRQDEPAQAALLYREVLRLATDDEILLRAGRKAIDLEEYTRTLGDLERVLAPLAFTFAHKDIYRRILVQLYARYVPALVSRAAAGDTEAAAELGRLGEHGIKPALEALADDADIEQQRDAVAILGWLGNKAAAAPLVRLARTPRPQGSAPGSPLQPTVEWDVRVEALVAAGRLGDPRIIPELVELLGHRETSMREAAAFALAATADRAAVPPLVAALADPRASVQTLACIGLARLHDRRAVTAAAAVVADGARSDEARAACSYALGALADGGSVAVLAAALAEGNDEAQRMAAWSLGRIGDRAGLPALLSAAFVKRDRVREAAVWALARVAGGAGGDKSALPIPSSYPLRAGKLDVRGLVRDLVGPLPAPTGAAGALVGHAAPLADALHDALGRHRDVLVRVLGDLDARDDGLALGPLTGDLDRQPAATRAAVRELCDRTADALVPDLVALAAHRDVDVRAEALAVLAKTGSPRARAPLLAALADPAPVVRRAALAAAARFRGDAPTRRALADAVAARLRADDWGDRVAAAEVLVRFGELADGDALAGALRDPWAFVREAAATSLGGLARPAAVPALLAASRDDVAAVRLAAVNALVAIGDRRARPRLAEIAGDDAERADVRAAARRFP